MAFVGRFSTVAFTPFKSLNLQRGAKFHDRHPHHVVGRAKSSQHREKSYSAITIFEPLRVARDPPCRRLRFDRNEEEKFIPTTLNRD